MLDALAPFRLDGRVAVVTGASSGLGARFARVLHGAGATVLAAARRTDRLDQLAAELGERVTPVTCDVTDDDACRRLIDQAAEAGGGSIAVLVNNAGIDVSMAAEREPPAEFRRVVDVNLNAVFVLSQLAFPALVASGHGSIVNVASVLGLVASAPINNASYAASKGAVVNLTRELGCQWSRKGVRVNAIAPGWFPSEMTNEMWNDERASRYILRNSPIGRIGEAHELDGVLLFLASDASSFVVGQTIAVDGGWTAR